MALHPDQPVVGVFGLERLHENGALVWGRACGAEPRSEVLGADRLVVVAVDVGEAEGLSLAEDRGQL